MMSIVIFCLNNCLVFIVATPTVSSFSSKSFLITRIPHSLATEKDNCLFFLHVHKMASCRTSQVIQLTMHRTCLLCPDIFYPWPNPKLNFNLSVCKNFVYESLIIQIGLFWVSNLKSKSELFLSHGTHSQESRCLYHLKRFFITNVLKPEWFQRHTVFVRQVCHLYLAITSATPWWIL